MKPAEIRELSPPELDKKLRDARDQLLNLQLRRQSGMVEKTHELKSLRKDVARMETIRREKAPA